MKFYADIQAYITYIGYVIISLVHSSYLRLSHFDFELYVRCNLCEIAANLEGEYISGNNLNAAEVSSN